MARASTPHLPLRCINELSLAFASNLLGCENWPTIRGVQAFNLSVLTLSPTLAFYGLFHVNLCCQTLWCTVGYFLFTTFGITAGYHRLWSHRAYKSTLLLQYLLILAGASAVQGSCFWWARRHRSHHRYTDTDRDPYNSKRGLFWTHIGWTVFRTDVRAGATDISDLQNDLLVQWQHRWYFPIAFVVGFLLPSVIPGLFWGDWVGGLCYVCALRMTICHHSVFCINSIAHYLGDKPYDDRLSPCDNVTSAILTMGEGYHNFHHQFPMDYRNAVEWYQFDPTKWFITLCASFGMASQLRVFPRNEIEKSAFAMKVKALKQLQDGLKWPMPLADLPVVTWDTFQSESKTRVLILVSGFIHDATDFVNVHPGGPALLSSNSGRDMTSSFFGGVYDHSNAAHNLLAMKRVAVLAGGIERVGEGGSIAPAQRLYIAEARNE